MIMNAYTMPCEPHRFARANRNARAVNVRAVSSGCKQFEREGLHKCRVMIVIAKATGPAHDGLGGKGHGENSCSAATATSMPVVLRTDAHYKSPKARLRQCDQSIQRPTRLQAIAGELHGAFSCHGQGLWDEGPGILSSVEIRKKNWCSLPKDH